MFKLRSTERNIKDNFLKKQGILQTKSRSSASSRSLSLQPPSECQRSFKELARRALIT